jgi:hypothetical protein
MLLTNPAYAGVYCYGKREKQVDPITQTTHVHKRDREEWDVFIPDHFPGYITLTEFEENQRILENNRNQYPTKQGVARRGPALLQGLVFCKHCGCKMRIRYSGGCAYYVCDAAHNRFGDPICNRASAKRVDALVEELFLTMVTAETLELSLRYDEKLSQASKLVDQGWQEKLQRMEYQADLARRRYEMVDPENRLVAHTLETEWNQRLETLEEAKRAYEAQRPTEYELRSTLEQMKVVITGLRERWYTHDVTMRDKKELLRCLVESVFLEGQGKLIRAEVNWQGGASSEL